MNSILSRGALAAGAFALLVACADPAGPPAMPASAGALNSSTTYGATLLECPISVESRKSARIGATGGSLELDGHRMALPLGAVTSPKSFTARVRASNYLEVDFSADGHSGFSFARPVTLTLDYSRCTRSNIDRTELRIYHIDSVTKQILEDMGGVDDKVARKVTTTTEHLSDFALGTPN